MNPESHLIRLALPLMLSILLGGCSMLSSQEGDSFVEDLLPVHGVDVKEQEGRHLTFVVHSGWGSSCGQITRFETEKAGRTYDVRTYGGQPAEIYCALVNTPLAGEWEIVVPEPGTYTFRFSRGEMAPLDTTIIVQ